MKQELTIAILLLAAGAGLWFWQNDSSSGLPNDPKSQTIRRGQSSNPVKIRADSENPGAFRSGAAQVDGENIRQIQEPSFQTVEFLQAAGTNLRNVPPFKTDLQIDLNWLDESLRLTGEYIQAGQGGELSRIKLQLPTASGPLSILKVCDGRFLYTQLKTPTTQSLEFVDLRRVAKRRNYQELTEPGNPTGWIAGDGIASILKNLAEAFEFKPVITRNVDDSRISIVRGTWNQEHLANLLHDSDYPAQKYSEINWELLPANLPHSVEIEFVEYQIYGTFPRRINLYRFQKNDQHQLVSKHFASIRFSTPQAIAVKPDEFLELETDNVDTVDATVQYVNQIIRFDRSLRASRESDTSIR